MMPMHASDRFYQWRDARVRAGAMLVALDFDGTLVPLQNEPANVGLMPDEQALLAALEARTDTHVALVSGRSLQDLEKRVGVPGIVYAGNHGLEIRGPDFHLVLDSALAAREELDGAAVALDAAANGVTGAWVEHKGLTLALHFRKARDSNIEASLRERVADALVGFRKLRVVEGKKIFEIVPAIAWNKGRALEWICGALKIPEGAPVLFLGDDRTDEDAFRVVAAHGGGIIVANPPPTSTSASSFLRSTSEVIYLLRMLAEF